MTSSVTNPQSQDTTGIATDASGKPVIDPSKNVLDLVGAAMQRQDDLREKDAEHIRELLRLHASHIEELRTAEHELLSVRAMHGEQMRQAEAARINAIREIDAQAVQRTAEVQATQAETLRTQVATTANAQALALSAALDPIIKDIAELRRFQYEAAGQKTQVVEARDATADLKPVLDSLYSLQRAQAEGVGGRSQVVETRAQSADNRGSWVIVFAVLSLVISLLSLIAAIILATT